MQRNNFLTSISLVFFAFLVQGTSFASNSQSMNLDVDSIPLPSVLRLIADFAELNLVVADDVTGLSTLHLSGVTWQEALNKISNQKRLSYHINDKTLYVSNDPKYFGGLNFDQGFTNDQDMNEEYENTIIKLKHAVPSTTIKAFSLKSSESLTGDDDSGVVVGNMSPLRITQLRQFIKAVDFPRQQLMIEARIVEVDIVHSKELGVIWSGSVSSGGFKSSTFVDLGAVATTSGAAVGYVSSLVTLDLELNAMQKAGHAKIISKPRVFAADRQQASIVRGSEVPYQQSAGDGATSTAFKQAALSLTVTPIVDEEGANLTIDLRKDAPDYANAIGGVPPINTASLSSRVRVKLGQTVALGGVFTESENEVTYQVPGISKIPFLGALFRYTSTSSSTSELMLFVTPTLVPF